MITILLQVITILLLLTRIFLILIAVLLLLISISLPLTTILLLLITILIIHLCLITLSIKAKLFRTFLHHQSRWEPIYLSVFKNLLKNISRIFHPTWNLSKSPFRWNTSDLSHKPLIRLCFIFRIFVSFFCIENRAEVLCENVLSPTGRM